MSEAKLELIRQVREMLDDSWEELFRLEPNDWVDLRLRTKNGAEIVQKWRVGDLLEHLKPAYIELYEALDDLEKDVQ